MNKIVTGILVVAVLLGSFLVTSCDGKEDISAVEYLEVTANNLQGEWELVSRNGEPMIESTYWHISFTRKDTGYVIKHNLSSSSTSSSVEEGVFEIGTDQNGAWIRGINSILQNWSQKYYVRDLTDTSMIWVGMNDGEVKVLRRIR